MTLSPFKDYADYLFRSCVITYIALISNLFNVIHDNAPYWSLCREYISKESNTTYVASSIQSVFKFDNSIKCIWNTRRLNASFDVFWTLTYHFLKRQISKHSWNLDIQQFTIRVGHTPYKTSFIYFKHFFFFHLRFSNWSLSICLCFWHYFKE